MSVQTPRSRPTRRSAADFGGDGSPRFGKIGYWDEAPTCSSKPPSPCRAKSPSRQRPDDHEHPRPTAVLLSGHAPQPLARPPDARIWRGLRTAPPPPPQGQAARRSQPPKCIPPWRYATALINRRYRERGMAYRRRGIFPGPDSLLDSVTYPNRRCAWRLDSFWTAPTQPKPPVTPRP